ncbi:MAG: MerR family transcriptional regulator [Anaerolineales bacterium]|nr:MerR family transcriptional regulator [Anaerolineales bacterium]
MYTIRQLSRLAGVTVRTLHYYDEIGLLNPTSIGENRYRYYDEDSLFRLQQILLYREMGMPLTQIKEIVDNRNFDLVSALQAHRSALQNKINRLKTVVNTIDITIMHLVGEVPMSNDKIFQGFNPEKQKHYEEQAENMWGEKAKQSIKLWYSYSEQDKQKIMQEGSQIYTDIIANLDKRPQSPEIQDILIRWHRHMRYFYEPTLEILRGLGDMYHDNPDFNATFTQMHPDLPKFLKIAINYYVDTLEKQ